MKRIMPIKDAIEWIRGMISKPVSEAELYCTPSIYGCGDLVFQDPEDYALNTALIELEKAEKYRWHDLRKNPDDLPDESLFFRSLLCVNNNGDYLTDCDLHWDEQCEWFDAESEGVYLTNVIAWKEIEPLQEDE